MELIVDTVYIEIHGLIAQKLNKKMVIKKSLPRLILSQGYYP